MGLKAWGRGGTKKEKEKEEEKIPHMCKSIGHRPLWGCCPKTKTFEIKNKIDIQNTNNNHLSLLVINRQLYSEKIILVYYI